MFTGYLLLNAMIAAVILDLLWMALRNLSSAVWRRIWRKTGVPGVRGRHEMSELSFHPNQKPA